MSLDLDRSAGKVSKAKHRLRVPCCPDVSIAVRESRPFSSRTRGVVVLVHGATVASKLFDVGIPGYSLLDALAQAGFAAYALDARGYGASSRPYLERGASLEPYARASEVVDDVVAVINWVREKEGVAAVSLVGGSWGSIIAALTACRHPSMLERLVLMAPLYAERNMLWLHDLDDPARPGSMRPGLPAFRWVQREDLLRRWDAEIPYPDKSLRRDEAVVEDIIEDLSGDEPDAVGQPRFRAPNGTLVDLFEVFSGRPLYDPAMIGLPTLLIRGAHDQTSTHSDTAHLFERLGARHKRYVLINDAGHFACIERNYRSLQAELTGFLRQHF